MNSVAFRFIAANDHPDHGLPMISRRLCKAASALPLLHPKSLTRRPINSAAEPHGRTAAGKRVRGAPGHEGADAGSVPGSR